MLPEKRPPFAAPVTDNGVPGAGLARENVRIIFWTYAVGFGAALFYYLINGVGLHRPYPYTTFLDRPAARFSDFTDMTELCRTLNPYNSGPGSSYPPFANLIYFLFASAPDFTSLLTFLAISVLGLFLLFARYLREFELSHLVWGIPLLLICSYPELFAIDRGNLDLSVAFLVGLFLLLYPRAAGPARDLACIALGVAIALKIYPLLFCLMFIRHRDIVSLLQSLAIAVLLTVLACTRFPGGLTVAIQEFFGMLQVVSNLAQTAIVFGYANVGLYYAGVLVLFKWGTLTALSAFRTYFGVASLAALLLYCGLSVWRRLEYWASATSIALLICLTPALSNDYRLTMLLPCVVLFLAKSTKEPCDSWVALLFGLLLVPKNYWILFPELPPGHVGVASLINPVLEVILFLLVQRYGWGFRRNASGEPPLPGLDPHAAPAGLT